MLKIGIIGTQNTIVGEKDTAEARLSGLLPVYATPALIAFVEYTCFQSIMPELEEGTGTVGTALNFKHLSASPVGAHIRCESELIEIDGRRLVFNVNAYDDFGLIGSGIHERFIIKNDRFMQKVSDKAAKLHDPDNKKE